MKTRELLNTQMSVDLQDNENLDSNDENMSKYEILDNAPFVLIEDKDGWAIVMGEHIVSGKRFENKELAKKYIDSKAWELIFVGASAYMKILEKIVDDRNNFNNLNDEQKG